VCVWEAWVEMSTWLCFCEMNTIEVKSGSLVLQYEGKVIDGGYCIVGGDVVIRGATYASLSGLNMFYVQSSWFMTCALVEFGLVWVASLAHFIIVGTSSLSIICTRPYPF
jgi:hypothetical protein